MVLVSSANFFTVNTIIDKITWECILYYMESEEFQKIAKNILGEDEFEAMRITPQGNARLFGMAIAGLIFKNYSEKMADDLELVKKAAANTNGYRIYGGPPN